LTPYHSAVAKKIVVVNGFTIANTPISSQATSNAKMLRSINATPAAMSGVRSSPR
jgi:hypothetical protein